MGKYLYTYIHTYLNTSKIKYQTYRDLKVATEGPFFNILFEEVFQWEEIKYLEIYYKRYRDLKGLSNVKNIYYLKKQGSKQKIKNKTNKYIEKEKVVHNNPDLLKITFRKRVS